MPETKKKGKAADTAADEAIVMPKSRPDVTRKGIEMIGDIRTDACRLPLNCKNAAVCVEYGT